MQIFGFSDVMSGSRGRPTKYREEMCEIALHVLGDGGSRAQLAATLEVGKDSLYAWERDYPDFSEAMARGLAMSEAKWESPDWHPEMHHQRWALNMKNRFGWTDRVESKVQAEGFTLVQNLAGLPK